MMAWLLHAALVLNQNAATDLAAAAAAMREGRGDQALALARRVVENDPRDLDALSNAGFIAEALGYDELAQDFFERAHRVEPGATYPLQMLGALAYDQGRLDASESYYRAALALAPANESLQHDLESILERKQTMGRLAAAKGRLRTALIATLIGYTALATGIALLIRRIEKRRIQKNRQPLE